MHEVVGAATDSTPKSQLIGQRVQEAPLGRSNFQQVMFDAVPGEVFRNTAKIDCDAALVMSVGSGYQRPQHCVALLIGPRRQCVSHEYLGSQVGVTGLLGIRVFRRTSAAGLGITGIFELCFAAKQSRWRSMISSRDRPRYGTWLMFESRHKNRRDMRHILPG